MSRRTREGVIEGAAVLVALGLVPPALLAALHARLSSGAHVTAAGLAVAAAAAWCVVVVGLARMVADRVRGRATTLESGPLAWAAIRVASLVLVVAPFLEPSAGGSTARAAHVSSASHRGATATAPARRPAAPAAWTVVERPRDDDRGTAEQSALRRAAARRRGGHRPVTSPPPGPALGTGGLLVSLAADLRRRVRTTRHVVLVDERAVDLETALLGTAASPAALLAAVGRCLEADGRLDRPAHVVVVRGEARLDDASWTFDPIGPQGDARCLVVVLGEDADGTHVLYVPRGSSVVVTGPDAESLVGDAVRVSSVLGLGRAVRCGPGDLLHALAVRADDELVVCTGEPPTAHGDLVAHCVVVAASGGAVVADAASGSVRLHDGRTLERASLSDAVRSLLDSAFDRPLADQPDEGAAPRELDDRGVVVRLLTAVPRVDGLEVELEPRRERRAVELVAYLALRCGEPVTGDRLRTRVLGTASSDGAAKTLFNVASALRRSLGDGPFGPRLPSAGRQGHYAVAPDVRCDVALLLGRAARARACAPGEERIAWLRAALDLVEGEPFATVLEGYDWFLAEGHLSRLQAVCEDVACELVALCVDRGLLALAGFAIDRASLVDPYSERLAAAAGLLADARQASFEAIAPAARSTEPSAPAVT